MAFASVPVDEYVVEQGAELVGRIASSSFGHREFCTRCGTPLLMKVDHQPQTVDFSLARLDEPAAVRPEFHIFYASRVPWAEPGDDLPRHDGFRSGACRLPAGTTGVD